MFIFTFKFGIYKILRQQCYLFDSRIPFIINYLRVLRGEELLRKIRFVFRSRFFASIPLRRNSHFVCLRIVGTKWLTIGCQMVNIPYTPKAMLMYSFMCPARCTESETVRERLCPSVCKPACTNPIKLHTGLSLGYRHPQLCVEIYFRQNQPGSG
jgi:hypothetical protein